MTKKLVILGSTRGTDLQYIIDQIEAKSLDAKIELVLSNKQDAYILERAKIHNLHTICIESKGKKRLEFDNLVADEIDIYNPDIIILIGFMRIMSSEFVKRFVGKIINVHPSLLPKFAGGMDSDVHAEVIAAGESESGCTVHLVTEDVDGGRILLQKKCKVESGETQETLKTKVQKLESEALVEVIRGSLLNSLSMK
jgi:phosphoribosylglycinamide formyltransferase 1